VDADPDEILVNWTRTPESSYLLIDVDAPLAESESYDINDKGEVLFSNGIWSAGTWTPLEKPDDVVGSFPKGDGTNQNYFITFDPQNSQGGYRHFDDNHNLAGMNGILLAGPADHEVSSVFANPNGQSAQDLAAAEILPGYASSSYHLRLYGMNSAQTVVAGLTYSMDALPPGSEIRSKLVLFPPNAASPVLRDLPNGARFRSSYYTDNFVSASGWITCHTGTGGSANGTVLWNPQGAVMALPVSASNGFATLNLSDLPKGENPANGANVGLVAANIDGSSQVLIPDMEGQMQSVDSMSDKNLKILSSDGTGITSDMKLWSNGKLTPLGELIPNFDELVAQGWSFIPLKANKHGVYLIQAINPAGVSMSKLLQPVRFNLRNHADYARGWDNTADERTPWTSCGTGKTNSLIGVIIPGCTEDMGNLLELVQHVPEGGDTYVTLANQSIHGVETRFDIKGLKATPANGCQIIVRQKTNHSNRSNALNVHVFPPRVVKFQVYQVNPLVGPQQGYVVTLADIKTELNDTYNEQANIRFEQLESNIIPVSIAVPVPAASPEDVNETDILNSDGHLPLANGVLLANNIRARNTARHLKIILVNQLMPDIAGITPFVSDWEIVNANVSRLDTYGHETGHSFNLASKGDAKRHEPDAIRVANDQHPLMYFSNGSTRWMRQEDWKLSNTEANDVRYGR
jgi:hypothetical protein